MIPKRHKKCPVRDENLFVVSRKGEKRPCEGFEYSWGNPHRIILPEGPIHESESALTLHHVLLCFKIFHEPSQLQAE